MTHLRESTAAVQSWDDDDTDVVIVDPLPLEQPRPPRARRDTLPYGARTLPSRVLVRIG